MCPGVGRSDEVGEADPAGSDMVEVVSGLKNGDVVVTSAQFLLDSESNLGDVMRSMIGQGVSTDKGADMKGMNMPSATKR